MIWMAISARGVSSVHVHQRKQAIRQGIEQRLIPFIKKFHSDGKLSFLA